MSETSTGPAVQQFVLRSALTVAAVGVGSALTLLGAVLLVLWNAQSWPVVMLVIAVVLLVLGFLLALLGLLAYRRLRQTVLLSADGITLRTSRDTSSLSWSEIKEVKVSGDRLTLVRTDERHDPVEVVNPRGPAEPVFVALMQAISSSLDADRGYRHL